MKLQYTREDALNGCRDQLAGRKAREAGPAYGFGRLYAKSMLAQEFAGTRRDRDAEEDAAYCFERLKRYGIDAQECYSTAHASRASR